MKKRKLKRLIKRRTRRLTEMQNWYAGRLHALDQQAWGPPGPAGQDGEDHSLAIANLRERMDGLETHHERVFARLSDRVQALAANLSRAQEEMRQRIVSLDSDACELGTKLAYLTDAFNVHKGDVHAVEKLAQEIAETVRGRGGDAEIREKHRLMVESAGDSLPRHDGEAGHGEKE